MPKILLIAPPCIELWKGLRDVTHKYPPLGLAYLASFLQKHNVEVQIYDSFVEDASIQDIERKIMASDAELRMRGVHNSCLVIFDVKGLQ